MLIPNLFFIKSVNVKPLGNSSLILGPKLYKKNIGVWHKINSGELKQLRNKITSVKDFERIINNVLQSSEKTMLIAIYNNQNQRRYIGVKLD